MKIYYSVYDAIERVSNNRKCQEDSGWGRLIKSIEQLFLSNNLELIYSRNEIENADIEFYVGQPPLNLRPSMHPAIMLSMFETTFLPKLWVDSLNRWDAIINPSDWGCERFEKNGVRIPIHGVPLPVNFDKFRFIERTIDGEWTFLTQAVQLVDRKNVLLVAELFEQDRMPFDAHLIIKTIPRKGQPELEISIAPQVDLIQTYLDLDDYVKRVLSESHVSVNPSSGEGFGYLPAESMATGLCTMMTNFSALTNLLDNDCTIPIDCEVTPSKVFVTGGLDADPDIEDMYNKMIWTYENREEALEMGVRSAQWIRQYCDGNKIFDSLSNIFDRYIKKIPKSILPEGEITEYVDFDSLRIKRRGA